MAKYHCPYCSPRYQFHKQRSDGVMICGQCGDPLVKTSPIKLTQIFALVLASVFIAPLFITAFAFIQDLNRSKPRNYIQSMSIVFTLNKSFSL
tara:strand:+ start:504 stop:782 length:279 start_codon:yes stop_codon:yes gene_type:complete